MNARYKLQKPNWWGYNIKISNSASKANGKNKKTQSNMCGKLGGDASNVGKLKVGFCKLPSYIRGGPFWVVAHNEDEGYALVSGGQPSIPTHDGCKHDEKKTSNSGLWIMTREQTRDVDLIKKVRDIATEKGLDVSVLDDVDQTSCK